MKANIRIELPLNAADTRRWLTATLAVAGTALCLSVAALGISLAPTAAVVSAGAAQSSAAAPLAPSSSGAARVVVQINAARHRVGLASLTRSASLDANAQRLAESLGGQDPTSAAFTAAGADGASYFVSPGWIGSAVSTPTELSAVINAHPGTVFDDAEISSWAYASGTGHGLLTAAVGARIGVDHDADRGIWTVVVR